MKRITGIRVNRIIIVVVVGIVVVVVIYLYSSHPRRWFGLSSGSSGIKKRSSSSISSRSLPSEPPIANPSNGRLDRYSADSCRYS